MQWYSAIQQSIQIRIQMIGKLCLKGPKNENKTIVKEGSSISDQNNKEDAIISPTLLIFRHVHKDVINAIINHVKEIYSVIGKHPFESTFFSE